MNKRISIIGGGPAGIATAIQLKRYNFDPIVFEKDNLGGLLQNANFIENYPGFPEGITGPDLVKIFIRHLKNNKITIIQEIVITMNFGDANKVFKITTENKSYYSDIVIVASGTKPKKLAITRKLPGSLKKYLIFDVKDFKKINNKSITIVGAGDIAFDYALTLSKRNKIIILNKNKSIGAIFGLQNYILHNHEIEYHDESEIVQIIPGKKKPLSLKVLKNDISTTFECDFLLTAIGREPHRDFLSSGLVKNENELINGDKLYFIGDVKNGIYRQVSIAVGDGIKTAMKIYLKNDKTINTD